jgi:hypothetical protein
MDATINLNVLPVRKEVNVELERMKYRKYLPYANSGDILKIDYYWKMASQYAGKEIYSHSEYPTTDANIHKALEYVAKCRKVFEEIKERIQKDEGQDQSMR